MAGKEAWIALGLTVGVCAVVAGAFYAGTKVPKSSNEQPVPRVVREAPPDPSPKPDEVGSNGFEKDWSDLIGMLSNKGLRPIAELSGNGSVQTQYFQVTAQDQYFVWGLDPSVPMRVFSISATNKAMGGDSIMPNAKEDWTGASWLHLNPGSYYLDVTAFGKWKVNIYQK